MAGGIDWFRWHHGTVTDQKFHVIAKRAGCSVAEAIAVWACLLEAASMADERGNPGAPDFEAMDCALGLDDGQSSRIYSAMQTRDLIEAETGNVVAWDKRQPRREDDTAADRKRRQREREHELQTAATVTHSKSLNVTHGHADVTARHDRGEESREEKKREKTGAKAPSAAFAPPEWVPAEPWLAFVKVRKAMRNIPFTDDAANGVVNELRKLCDLGYDAGELLQTAVTNGWRTVYPPKGAGPPSGLNKQELLEQSNRERAATWAAKKLREVHETE